jgi:hypothetical protein
MAEKRCPCCSKPLEPVPADDPVLSFRALMKENDVREVFRIKGDGTFVLAPGMEAQEAARLFAESLNAYISDRRLGTRAAAPR